jgi:hypothetical protein
MKTFKDFILEQVTDNERASLTPEERDALIAKRTASSLRLSTHTPQTPEERASEDRARAAALKKNTAGSSLRLSTHTPQTPEERASADAARAAALKRNTAGSSLRLDTQPWSASGSQRQTPEERASEARARAAVAKKDRASSPQTNDPFELYPDFGDAEPSVHRARDARDRGLSHLEKRRASRIPKEEQSSGDAPPLGAGTEPFRPSKFTGPLSKLGGIFARKHTPEYEQERIESGKMTPNWSRYTLQNINRPQDEYGYTDLDKK